MFGFSVSKIVAVCGLALGAAAIAVGPAQVISSLGGLRKEAQRVLNDAQCDRLLGDRARAEATAARRELDEAWNRHHEARAQLALHARQAEERDAAHASLSAARESLVEVLGRDWGSGGYGDVIMIADRAWTRDQLTGQYESICTQIVDLESAIELNGDQSVADQAKALASAEENLRTQERTLAELDRNIDSAEQAASRAKSTLDMQRLAAELRGLDLGGRESSVGSLLNELRIRAQTRSSQAEHFRQLVASTTGRADPGLIEHLARRVGSVPAPNRATEHAVVSTIGQARPLR